MESIGLQKAPFHLERFLFLLTKPKIEALWQIFLLLSVMRLKTENRLKDNKVGAISITLSWKANR